ncbi:hypothetical protein OPV22_027634 [Ensete ventricosum]|uniref:Uncharacterized protein n=1 Tax=Ensete ventricosum TaxID=4639 RepID=A0AAV8PW71_ENSVE|nr:hypothetical protein OPV22_027634 [Ensete ventricosum]
MQIMLQLHLLVGAPKEHGEDSAYFFFLSPFNLIIKVSWEINGMVADLDLLAMIESGKPPNHVRGMRWLGSHLVGALEISTLEENQGILPSAGSYMRAKEIQLLMPDSLVEDTC